jgi:hypothetical protein
MQSPTQGSGNPGACFLWEPAGKAISIYLALDVIDRLLPEILRGFGAVPKRGAEVGGFLLGRIARQEDGRTIVHITDFHLVACEYRRGPSFLLSEDDLTAYEESFEFYEGSGGAIPVGYFRSHTREGLSLSEEDQNLCAGFFPAPDRVALLVKPFATRTSTAAFFHYEDSCLVRDPSREFPFRRRELEAAAVAPPFAPAPMFERLPAPTPTAGKLSAEKAPSPAISAAAVSAVEGEPFEVEPPSFTLLGVPRHSQEARRNWKWIPLSFILLLGGAAAGFYGAERLRPVKNDPSRYEVRLEARAVGGNVQIRWDRTALPVAAASHGELRIEDGEERKVINLDRATLDNGSILYRSNSPTVRARITLRIGSSAELSESMVWTSPAASP